jgi:GNAT superfamily N-acetyltransferase
MMEGREFSLQRSEPIFPVANVVATVGYYCDVLGFTQKWLWGEPPDFGGVRWGKVGAMFALQSLGAPTNGQWHSFFVEGIDALYDFQRRNGATIQSPLEAKPWGLREYTVRDLNGHFLRFGQRGSDRSATGSRTPASEVAIVERLPTLDEYRALMHGVGWVDSVRPERAGPALTGARFGVVAMDHDRAIGAGLVLGDGVTFAYLKDIVVLPEWQSRGVGSRIVQMLLNVIRRTSPDGILVTLFTGANLTKFYGRFGFCGTEMGHYGMCLRINRLNE